MLCVTQFISILSKGIDHFSGIVTTISLQSSFQFSWLVNLSVSGVEYFARYARERIGLQIVTKVLLISVSPKT